MNNINTTQLLDGIKIARISTVPFFIVTQLKAQVEHLRDSGGDVVLISSLGDELSQMKLSSKLRHKNITIPRRLEPLRDMIALAQLYSYFRKESFDIVHSTTPKAGLLTALAAFFAGVPIRLHTFTGQPWVTMRNPLRFVARMCDAVIGVLNTKCYADSDSQAQFLSHERIIPAHKMAVIGNGSIAGVDLNRFSKERYSQMDQDLIKQELQLSPDAVILLYVGRITRDKGINELVYAFNKIIELGQHAELLLVGPTDSDCGGAESISIKEISQVPRVHIIGYCKDPEKYMAIADILCLPSYREGFGTVVIEAAAMGIPTLGTEIDGLTDAVANGETGVLVPPGDKEALLKGLLTLLESPDAVKLMGGAAQRRCCDLFDANAVNKYLVEEYKKLLCQTNK